jgi:hypothetical protein
MTENTFWGLHKPPYNYLEIQSLILAWIKINNKLFVSTPILQHRVTSNVIQAIPN